MNLVVLTLDCERDHVVQERVVHYFLLFFFILKL